MLRIGYEYVINFRPKDWEEVEYDLYWNHFSIKDMHFYENKLNLKQLNYCDDLELSFCEHLRSKRKWRVMTARLQVRTKHCRSVRNMPHGLKLHINHRVLERMRMPRGPPGTNIIYSIKSIDKRKGFTDRKELTQPVHAPAPRYIPSQSQQSYPIAQPTPAAAISAYNFDGDLPADVVNMMIQLQTRDSLALSPRIDLRSRRVACLESRLDLRNLPRFQCTTSGRGPAPPC